MKKMILISMVVITLLGLMSFTATNKYDFDNSKAVYSGPCGNYSVSVNTLVRMYLMLPDNIRKDMDKTFAQDGHLLFDESVCTLYGVNLESKRVPETGNYDFIITYQDHTIKINDIRMDTVMSLFNFVIAE